MARRKDFKNSIRSLFGDIDLPLFAAVAAVSLFGAVNMYGIIGPGSLLTKHFVFIGVGLSLMIFLSFVNYRYLKNYSFPVLALYLLSIFLLLLTFYSRSVRGVNAWIVLGQFTFEPAELVKLMLIVVMAKYFSQRHVHINQFKYVVISGIYYILPVGIMLMQPDLGSAIIISVIWLGMLLAAGINKRHLFLLVILGVVISYGGWISVLKPYQKERLVSFINPGADPLDTGYNLIQSQVAIGSGHWFGNGVGNGSQATLGFLPEPHNDFVFAAAAEQFGLVGIGLVLLVISFIISRTLLIGRLAMSNFGKLFSIGITILIFSHALIGASVNVGLMPVTGLPFPFLSYGGSYMISLMVGLGVLQSIKRHN